MTLLRGHFAMMLVTAGDADAADVEEALGGADRGRLAVGVGARGARRRPAGRRGSAYLLSVHGGDRPGIVSAVAAEVADVGGNITDLTTRLAGDLYVLIAEVDLPGGCRRRGARGVRSRGGRRAWASEVVAAPAGERRPVTAAVG